MFFYSYADLPDEEQPARRSAGAFKKYEYKTYKCEFIIINFLLFLLFSCYQIDFFLFFVYLYVSEQTPRKKYANEDSEDESEPFCSGKTFEHDPIARLEKPIVDGWITPYTPWWRRMGVHYCIAITAATWSLFALPVAVYMVKYVDDGYPAAWPDFGGWMEYYDMIPYFSASFGAVFYGFYVTDRIGRWKAFMYEIATLAIGDVIAASASGSVEVAVSIMFIGSAITGVGAGGMIVTIGALAVEQHSSEAYTPAIITAFQLAGFLLPYIFGAMFAPLQNEVAFRFIFIFPAMLCCSVYFFVPKRKETRGMNINKQDSICYIYKTIFN